MNEPMQVPELDDAQFCTEVMQLGVNRTELQHDRELLTKAHGLGIMATLPTVSEAQRVTSSAMSDSTESTSRDQTFSTMSDGSTVTNLTPHSSIYGAPSPSLSSVDNKVQKNPCRSLNFAVYDKYLALVDMVQEEPRSRKIPIPLESSGHSIFSVSTRKSLSGVRSGFRNRMKLRKRSARIDETPVFCFTCHTPFNKSSALQNLPCGHANCAHCLRDLAVGAIKDELSMPPSCCAKPVPSETLQQALDVDVQESFLKAVLQYSTPAKTRVFCCNPSCGEFIPPLKRVDTNMPSAVTCLKCSLKACPMCKQGAHPIGIHCPEDWELLDALKIGGSGSWRRCFRCRKLVELIDSIGPATCSCKAQFCCACGGVWDIATGCPNVCKGEEELARRRREEQERAAEAEASAATKQEEAEMRSREHTDVQFLLEAQRKEMQRMLDFKEAAATCLKARHSAQEVALANKHVEDKEAVTERHARDTSQLEDHQIAEELDLRSSLEQAARSIKVRIKHMEAYCDGLGQNPNGSSLPPRVVTEQNIRDLGHQYNLRDDLQRQHQAKINMMRDRQSKRMEELVEKHQTELAELTKCNHKATGDLQERLLQELEMFSRVFDARQSRLTARWVLAIEVQCKQLQEKDGFRYAKVALPSWPQTKETPELSTS